MKLVGSDENPLEGAPVATQPWTCKCGSLTYNRVRGSLASIYVYCPLCGDSAELMVLPPESA